MASRIMSPRRQRMSGRCDKTAAADDADCPHSFDQPTTSFLFAAKCRQDQDAFFCIRYDVGETDCCLNLRKKQKQKILSDDNGLFV